MPNSGTACGRADDEPLTRHARALFDAATACAYVNGEPGFINGDRLEDARTGFARAEARAPREAGSVALPRAGWRGRCWPMSRAAPPTAHFPVTTNPCGEVVLHVTGGYCVIADFAPLLACPVPLRHAVARRGARRCRARLGCAGRGCGAPRRALPDPGEPDGCALCRRGRAHQPHRHRPDRAARMGLGALRPGLPTTCWTRTARGPSGMRWRGCRMRRRRKATAYAASLGMARARRRSPPSSRPAPPASCSA